MRRQNDGLVLWIFQLLLFIKNASPNCLNGYYSYDGDCYGAPGNALFTWDQAENYCVSQGGHLTSVTSRPQHDFLLNLIRQYKIYHPDLWNEVWIGLYHNNPVNYDSDYYAKRMGWQWSDGAPYSFYEWDPLDPSNNERYARISNGVWLGSLTGNGRNNFICKIVVNPFRVNVPQTYRPPPVNTPGFGFAPITTTPPNFGNPRIITTRYPPYIPTAAPTPPPYFVPTVPPTQAPPVYFAPTVPPTQAHPVYIAPTVPPTQAPPVYIAPTVPPTQAPPVYFASTVPTEPPVNFFPRETSTQIKTSRETMREITNFQVTTPTTSSKDSNNNPDDRNSIDTNSNKNQGTNEKRLETEEASNSGFPMKLLPVAAAVPSVALVMIIILVAVLCARKRSRKYEDPEKKGHYQDVTMTPMSTIRGPRPISAQYNNETYRSLSSLFRKNGKKPSTYGTHPPVYGNPSMSGISSLSDTSTMSSVVSCYQNDYMG